MKISYAKYSLTLRHQFTISYNSRSSTPVVLIRIEHEGFTGYGEASLPPYLHETQDSVIEFLRKAASVKSIDVTAYAKFLMYVDKISEGNTAAKASIDIAMHDLIGKIQNKPCYKFYQEEKRSLPFTSFTIGIDDPSVIKQKIKEAEQFKILKVKLGTNHDREFITLIREETDKPIYADINQGWNNKEEALDNIYWLRQKNVLLIEQPFPKNDLDNSAWLTGRSPLPIIADESIQRLADIEKIKNSFTGINIKLMKCTGVNEAFKMILRGRELGLKIMLGCMTETSCAISAALHLSSLVDYADLDGNLLITNDPFNAVTVSDGLLQLSDKPGLGVDLYNELKFIDIY